MSQFLSKPETINPLAANSNWRNTVHLLQPCAYQGGSLSGTGGAIFSSWTLCVAGTSWFCICSTWSASSRGLSDNPHFERSCVLYMLLKESLSSALGKNWRLQMKWYSRLNNQWSMPDLTYCLLFYFRIVLFGWCSHLMRHFTLCWRHYKLQSRQVCIITVTTVSLSICMFFSTC
jgi:hypothetical protein